MINVLLDTNVLIKMEDTGKEMPEDASAMMRLSQGHVAYYYHPDQTEDINRDRNDVRRRIVLSRIGQFKPLEFTPTITAEIAKGQGWSHSSANDFIDNELLYCILTSQVDYLVTEDKEMHRKAERSQMRDRVLSIKEFISLLGGIAQTNSSDLACVKGEYCRALNVNDSFFDSIKEDYPAFSKWFEKCSRSQRQCWTIRKDGKIVALCIWKIEDIPDCGVSVPGVKGKVLKLCTFKVSETLRGAKVGERLLYTAFQFCRKNKLGFVYFHTNPDKQTYLIKLAEEFGFRLLGDYAGDAVYGKYTDCPDGFEKTDAAKYVDSYFPSYLDGSQVQKYLVPIQPQWHERLFPDISTFYRESLFSDYPEMYSSESNTIRKVYISRSGIRRIRPGDLLLFYRSGDRKSVEPLGVVKSAVSYADFEALCKSVERRTVYSRSELYSIFDGAARGLLVITFDLIGYYRPCITVTDMHKADLQASQSICRVDHKSYLALVKGRQICE